MCREGGTQLTRELRDANIKTPVIGIVHEATGVAGFREHFGEHPIYLDASKHMYSKVLGDRWLELSSAIFSLARWKNVWRATRSGFKNNREGEGRLLGGLVVCGAHNSGIKYLHKEATFGDHPDYDKVVAACMRIQQQA
jgi:hypothetical protein